MNENRSSWYSLIIHVVVFYMCLGHLIDFSVFYGGCCGEAGSGETSKWSSSQNSCVGPLSDMSLSWGGVCSLDSTACGFLVFCGSFRNLMGGREEVITLKQCAVRRKSQRENYTRTRGQRPEEEFLSSLLFNDVEFVVVSQSPRHFLIGHIISVLWKEITHHQRPVLQHLLCCYHVLFLLFCVSASVFMLPVGWTTQARVLTLWFPQRRASPLGSTTLNTRLSRSSHRMYAW